MVFDRLVVVVGVQLAVEWRFRELLSYLYQQLWGYRVARVFYWRAISSVVVVRVGRLIIEVFDRQKRRV